MNPVSTFPYSQIFRSGFFAVLATLIPVSACNVDSAPGSTGGVDLGGPAATAVCDRGVVTVMTDYSSTNVALSGPDGTTLSGSFLSSGAKPPGLSLALSGDVELPASAPLSGRVVLLDRFGTNVVTWVDATSAQVLGQLPVGTGFEANPQDYLEVDDTRAYLTRYETNAAPGQQPFDEGGDVLVLDTKNFAVTKRIPLPMEDSLPPRPSEMLRLGDHVLVVLQRLSADFKVGGDGVLLGIQAATDSIAWTIPLPGLRNCNRPVLAPDGATFALACSGVYDAATDLFDANYSDVVLFDAKTNPPQEIRRYGVASKVGGAVQGNVAFASARLLMMKAYGTLDGASKDRVLSLDVETGDVQTLLTASQGGLRYGGVWCRPGCSDVCLLADADKNVLQRWQVTAPTTMELLPPVTVETTIGLPPRSLGGF